MGHLFLIYQLHKPGKRKLAEFRANTEPLSSTNQSIVQPCRTTFLMRITCKVWYATKRSFSSIIIPYLSQYKLIKILGIFRKPRSANFVCSHMLLSDLVTAKKLKRAANTLGVSILSFGSLFTDNCIETSGIAYISWTNFRIKL